MKLVEKELREANQIKDKMFSIIGHDLRNPVGSFKSTLDLLIDRPNLFKKESIQGMLKSLKISANATFFLLEDLLLWARSQRNKIRYEPNNIFLHLLIKENQALLGNLLQQKSIKLINEIDEEIEVFADQNMLRIILRNLVNNAIKFSYKGAEIKIFTSKKDNFIEISIQDQGIGISKENQDKIFLQNEHFTTFGTNEEKGSGLGLMLCKDFVKKHKGKLWVESEINKGATFKFTIPYKN